MLHDPNGLWGTLCTWGLGISPQRQTCPSPQAANKASLGGSPPKQLAFTQTSGLKMPSLLFSEPSFFPRSPLPRGPEFGCTTCTNLGAGRRQLRAPWATHGARFCQHGSACPGRHHKSRASNHITITPQIFVAGSPGSPVRCRSHV